MATIEVDEDQLSLLQQAHKLLNEMARNPGSKAYTEKALKAVVPGYVPEDERAELLAKPYIEKVESVAKSLQDRLDAITERETKAKEADELATLTRQFDDLRRGGYTDEGIEKVKKIMVDRGIPDVEAAAALHAKHQPPTPMEPASYEPEFYQLNAKGDDLAAWFKNADRQEDIAIADTLRELRSNVGAV